MDDQNKNLILATALSFLVILVWFALFPPPEPETPLDAATSSTESGVVSADGTVAVPTATDTTTVPAQGAAVSEQSREDALANAPRVPLETDRLLGSISLIGGRIDDLKLKDYRTSVDEDSDIVTALSPQGTSGAQDTEWTLSQGDTLGLGKPVILSWDNGKGQTFTRTIAVDENYMFTVTQAVTNNADAPISLAPYGLIAQHGIPQDLEGFFILHEGAIAEANGELAETDWDDIPDAPVSAKWGRPAIVKEDVSEGWIGFTDHYWQTILIPETNQPFDQVLTYAPRSEIFHAFAYLPSQTVAAGQTSSVTTQVFAGAKEWALLREYEANGVSRFIESIDWGWFAFLTKPIFWLLHHLNNLIGNMGWAIIGLTLIIKAILFPLAYKSYVSMAKMKELQPQMEELKKSAGDDRQKMQQGMMELYKKEKVNPAAGCLPILLQIPIFFSLYKVIFVTLELRHAPFFGPFQDLSAPDPTSIFNLYGLLPWAAPEPQTFMALIFIGILPLLLGISMWLQQKLNPAPTDPTQQMIFAWMPWVFMFMLGSFASGLVVYWIANNTITFTQQYLIMRSQGYKPDLLGNIKGSFKRKPKAAADK